MPTPHNNAAVGQIAKTVLMPGDPMRAKYIAENFIDFPELVNDVRGMLAYTGTYRDKPVTVMASGMGMPSMAIYSHELFNDYGVDNISRIGTAGAVSESIQLRDIVFALACCTNSSYADHFRLPCRPVAAASYTLLKKADAAAEKLDIKVNVGTVLCTDVFYEENSSLAEWRKMGILATEMESAALYYNAARSGKNALCICTVSDCPITGEACSANERQDSFTDMVRIALETASML